MNFRNLSHPLFSDLFKILHSFSLSQEVQEDTHTSPQGSTSLIDLALVSAIVILLCYSLWLHQTTTVYGAH